MEGSDEEEEVRELEFDKDFLPDEQVATPLSPTEQRANTRFLVEESAGNRGPRFSNPTIERLNSFRYRKSPPKGVTADPVIHNDGCNPRVAYQTSYDSVETRQRTAPPQISLRRSTMTRSTEALPVKNIPAITHNTGSKHIPSRYETHKETASLVPVKEFIPAVGTRTRDNRNTTRSSTPTSKVSKRPITPQSTSSARSTTPPASARTSTPKIPFSNSSRVAASIEFMSPIRARNALAAAAASSAAKDGESLTEPSWTESPTPIRRSRSSSGAAARERSAERHYTAAEDRSVGGGWNSSMRVKRPTANDEAIEHIAQLKYDSGEKPLPKRRSYTPQRTGASNSVDGRSSAAASQVFTPVSSRLYGTQARGGSRSSTPNSTTVRRGGGEDCSVVSGMSSVGRSTKSPNHQSRTSDSLLSPYNMMVSNRALDSTELSDADLKTIGKQLLLLKLMLETKMTQDCEKEEEDLLQAWQTVRDAEEQARVLAGQDEGLDEITTVHQQISDMESLVEKVTERLVPVFERLSVYLQMQNNECNIDSSIIEAKVKTHTELQSRLTSLTKSVAILKKHAETVEFSFTAKDTTQRSGSTGRRQSLNSHVTASAAARRTEDRAAHERNLAAVSHARTPPVPTSAAPKPISATKRASFGSASERPLSPSVVKATRRISLNSHVTASTAARRSEAAAAKEIAAALAAKQAVAPKPARASLGSTRSESTAAQRAASPALTRRLSLNSHLTASQQVRRSEEKAAHDKNAKTSPTPTSISRNSLGSAKSPPSVPSHSSKSNNDTAQRRLSLNSHLTASQQARRAKIVEERGAHHVNSPPRSPPKSSQRSPKSDTTTRTSFEMDEHRELGMHKKSLNSQMTASQLARRAEVQEEHKEVLEAAHADSPPKSPGRSPKYSITHPRPFSTPNHPTRTSEGVASDDHCSTKHSDSSTVYKSDFSPNSHLTASQEAHATHNPKTHIGGVGTHSVPFSQTYTAETKLPLHDPVHSSPESPMGARKVSLNSHMTASQLARRAEVKAEHPHSPPKSSPSPHSKTTVSKSNPHAPHSLVGTIFPNVEDNEAESAVNVVSDSINATVLNITETADPLPTSENVNRVDTFTSEATANPIVNDQTVEEAGASCTYDDSLALSVTALDSVSDTPTQTDSPVVGVDLRSPERKARSEAFERLMKRMNINKDSPVPSPVGAAARHSAFQAFPSEPSPKLATYPVGSASKTSTAENAVAEENSVKALSTENIHVVSEIPVTAAADEHQTVTVDSRSDSDAAPVSEINMPGLPITNEKSTTENSKPETELVMSEKPALRIDASVIEPESSVMHTPSSTVSAAISKFSDPVRSISITSTCERPAVAAGVSPKREKSARVAELMSKFSNSPKKESSSVPTPGKVAAPKRASVASLGDIKPVKAVFESKAEEIPTSSNEGADVSPKKGSANVESDHTAPSAIESSAAESDHAAPSAIESPAAESDHAAPSAIEFSAAEFHHAAPSMIESPVAESDHAAPSAIESPVVESDHAAPSAIESPVAESDHAAPSAIESPVAESDHAAPSAIESPVAESNLDTVIDIAPTADVSTDENVEAGSDILPPAEHIVCSASAAVEEPAASNSGANQDQTEMQENLRDASVVAIEAHEEATEDAESLLPKLSETFDTSHKITPAPINVSIPPVQGKDEEQEKPLLSPIVDVKTISTPKGSETNMSMEAGSDAGTDTSTHSKKRRPTLKGLWKRVKSATSSSKGDPFESEGWKPSPMVPEEEHNGDFGHSTQAGEGSEQDGGADWSTPDVFGSPASSSKKKSPVDLTAADSQKTEESTSPSKRRHTLKGVWNMVKSSSKN